MKKKPLYCPFYVGQPTEKEHEALFRRKQQADAERKELRSSPAGAKSIELRDQVNQSLASNWQPVMPQWSIDELRYVA